MERVRSRSHHTPKTTASRTENTAELIHSGTLSWSVRMSVYSVPVTLTTTTVSQYGNGTYCLSRSWMIRTTTKTAVKITAVATRPTPSCMLIQSAKLSPTVVQRILINQNQMVTSGTLFSSTRGAAVRGAVLVVIPATLSRRTCRQPDYNRGKLTSTCPRPSAIARTPTPDAFAIRRTTANPSPCPAVLLCPGVNTSSTSSARNPGPSSKTCTSTCS